MSLTLVVAMIFLDRTPKAQATKAEINNVRLHQNKKLLHSKRNNLKNEKAPYRMGEDTYK